MKKRWILLPLLGIAGYVAVFGGEYSWMDIRRLERQRKVQEQAAQATRDEVRRLRARADSLQHDSVALERIAREKYGLIRNGERLYRFAEGARAGVPSATTPPRPDSAAARGTAHPPPAPAKPNTPHRRTTR